MVAPRLLWRYILRDVFVHALLGLFAITLLLVVQNVLRFMEDLIAAGVGPAELGQLVMLVLPTYAPYAIPTSLLFGILISFGRMSADGEIVAMRACGVSVARLLPPALALGAAGTLLTGWMLFDLQPRASYAMRTLVRQLVGSLDAVEAGKFNEIGDRLIYVHSHGGESCPLEGILIGDATTSERSFYAVARCGQLEGDPKGSQFTFVMHDGSIHFRDPDPGRYRRISFETMRTSIDLSKFTNLPPAARDLRFSQLIAARRLPESDPERKRVEGQRGTSLDVQIHRRLAFPLASLLLAVVAVPLGIRPVRTGRSTGALTAVAVMAVYWILFSLGETAAESKVGPAWLGLWMPNVITLGLGVWLMRRLARSDS